MKYILALFVYDLLVILGFLILRHYYDPFYVTSVAFVVLFCKVMLMRLIWSDGTKRPLPDFLPKGTTKNNFDIEVPNYIITATRQSVFSFSIIIGFYYAIFY